MSDAESRNSSSVLDTLREWYAVPVLVTIFAVMLAIRLQAYEAFIRNGNVYYTGNDAWYHLREVRYTVHHWPSTMPFDPWTNFPFGTNAGQFGTVYDQIVATAALVLGLGSPSETLVAKTLLVAPAVFGALVVVPTYLVGKRLGGRVGALVGAVVLMLLPGSFLRRGLVGFADHNIAEPLFQTFAVLGIMIALTVAHREKPVWELVVDRDYDALRRPTYWATVAGALSALYMWVWPPGVLLLGIVGVYTVFQMVSDVANERSPEPVAYVVVVSMAVAGALMLLPLARMGFGVTDFSLLQVLMGFGLAAGAAFLAGLARYWERADYPGWAYTGTVVVLIAVAVVVFRFVLPSAYDTVARNFLRTVGFSAGAATRTIGEAQPFLAPDALQSRSLTRVNRIMSEYGFALFTGVVAAVWLFVEPLVEEGEARELGYVGGGLALVALLFLIPAVPAGIGGALGIEAQLVGLAVVTLLMLGAVHLAPYDPERLFVFLWAAFITATAFTQVRFNYYLAVSVAVMNAYLVNEILAYLDLRTYEAWSNVEGYQVLAVVAALMLILTPVLMVPMTIRNTGNAQYDKSNTAWQAAQQTGPGAVTHWKGSLDWMQNNTPKEGHLGGANNSSALDYYGTYESTDDFAYPNGSYGVQSWWDYGHYITVLGHRIPNANPFQQGATAAANYLLAPNEEQARQVLQNRSADGEGEKTKYVMVDWQMVEPTSKFGAPVVWYDNGNISRSDFYRRVYSVQNGRVAGSFMLKHQRYYESMMVRLYEYHGSAMSPQPVVVDWERRQFQTQGGQTVTVPTVTTGNNSTSVRQFRSMREARAYVQNDSTSQIGGVGPYPSERVSALEHYRLAKVSNASATRSGSYTNSLVSTARALGLQPNQLIQTRPAWVKTFERVPGATVRGSGAPPNSTVTARVQMRSRTSNSSFYYVQRAQANENGEFTMTLPYSTTGYEQYGPSKGYTNVNVRAQGAYTFRTQPTISSDNGSASVVRHRAQNVSVPEGLVNGARNGTVTVSLERSTQQLGGNNSSSGNATSGNATAGNATGSSNAGGNVTGGNATGGSGSGSLSAPAGAVTAPELAAESRRSGA